MINVNTKLPDTLDEYLLKLEEYFNKKYNYSIYNKIIDKQIEFDILNVKRIVKEYYNKDCNINFCYNVPSLKITKCVNK